MRPESDRSVVARPRRKGGLFALALLIAGGLASGARAQDYRLQAGDVIEMSVAGLPQMSARAAVQIDGSLSLPLIGTIEAAGATVIETRERIQTALASRLLPVYLPDGREATRAIDRDHVSASVVEYRPIFVSGEVAQPGELPFRPGMTVRQAIAAAGGVAAPAPVASALDPIELRADYAEAWRAAASASARVWRLRDELGEDEPFDREAWPPSPARDEIFDEILRLETDLRYARASAFVGEREFLEQTLEQIDGQTEILRRQLEVERKSEETDAEALSAALQASERGLYTQARLADIRSAALISSTRRLQTESNLMQLERRRTEVARDFDRISERRRLDLLSELRDARVAEDRERARLAGVEEKLRAAGLAVAHSEPALSPQISIIRSGADHPEAATDGRRLEPGDIVQVTRRAEAFSAPESASARAVPRQDRVASR